MVPEESVTVLMPPSAQPSHTPLTDDDGEDYYYDNSHADDSATGLTLVQFALLMVLVVVVASTMIGVAAFYIEQWYRTRKRRYLKSSSNDSCDDGDGIGLRRAGSSDAADFAMGKAYPAASRPEIAGTSIMLLVAPHACPKSAAVTESP